MGKRIAATKHLAIGIDCTSSWLCTPKDIMRYLRKSGHKLNAHMETLIVNQLCQCWLHNQGWTCDNFYRRKDCSIPKEGHTGRLGELVMSSCPRLRTISLTLDKAPSWQVHGPFLRHICLRIPPST